MFRPGRRGLAASRLAVGVLIANILPAVGLWWLFASDSVLPLGASGGGAVLAAALASLSVFAIPRLLHAFIATGKVYAIFYTEAEWRQVVKAAGAETSDSFWAHFIPGIAYIVVFVSVAWLVQRVLAP